MDDTNTLPDDRLLSTRDAAQFLGVSRQTLYTLHRKGCFPAIVLSPGLTNWRLDDLRAYIATKTRRVRSG
ncbi:helix-turn-helix transcriptional regulator [Paracoccus ravus]|uniref:helix-turn-helix transcriptional regulator n=1 Tax=Paracoccus ravus TaxID=2447760 RepID=UPI00106E8116|nr:helix-turn-helix domain-containing protein [Paracoccus ravus]